MPIKKVLCHEYKNMELRDEYYYIDILRSRLEDELSNTWRVGTFGMSTMHIQSSHVTNPCVMASTYIHDGDNQYVANLKWDQKLGELVFYMSTDETTKLEQKLCYDNIPEEERRECIEQIEKLRIGKVNDSYFIKRYIKHIEYLKEKLRDIDEMFGY